MKNTSYNVPEMIFQFCGVSCVISLVHTGLFRAAITNMWMHATRRRSGSTAGCQRSQGAGIRRLGVYVASFGRMQCFGQLSQASRAVVLDIVVLAQAAHVREKTLEAQQERLRRTACLVAAWQQHVSRLAAVRTR